MGPPRGWRGCRVGYGGGVQALHVGSTGVLFVAGRERITAIDPRANTRPRSLDVATNDIRTIGDWSNKLSAKTFAITDLYGFWLPLYQFISAVINVFVGRLLDVEANYADVHYFTEVPPENVVEIWQPGHPEYDRHAELPRG